MRRKEDVRFLTGRATYVGDVKVPDALHAAVLRSPHGHARIRAIDTRQALKIPGVTAVFTFADIAPFSKGIRMRQIGSDTSPIAAGLSRFLQHPLAEEKVRYVGEPVALAVAGSRYLAEDALDAIRVTYEPLPAVVDIRRALKDEVVIHEENGTNLAAHYTVSVGDIQKAFQSAEYTRKEEFKVHRHTGVPLETRGLLASYDAGQQELTVWGPTKVPHFNRRTLSSFLDIPESKIHFIEPDVGGGFGIRGEFYPEDFLIPFAAIKLERPVKWIEDRREHLMAANHSREHILEIEVAARRDGTLLGMRAHVFGDMGGYIRTHGGLVPSNAARLLTGPYRVPNYECEVSCVITNKMGAGTFRAPGRYESCFARERLLDMMAKDLGLDPVELRLKNFVSPSEMPYEVGVTLPGDVPTVYDSGNYASALDRALKQADYEQHKELQGRLVDGRYQGTGVACFVKNTGHGPFEDARVVVHDTGRVSVSLGIATLGQGHETSVAQVCADGLGVPLDSIAVLHGTTDLMASGNGTFGSRGMVMAGNAVYSAAQQLRQRVLALASTHLRISEDDLEMREGRVYLRGMPVSAPLLELGDVVNLSGDESAVLEVTARFESRQYAYPYGTHVAHVAVDAETGMIEILGYVVVEDVGRAINPLLLHGQAVGAAAQGIGGTILEELVYDENGQLLTTTLMDYLLPTSMDVPSIESVVLEEAPSPNNPLGVKGAGEGGIIATGAALANAVANALAPLGVEGVTELPLSPDRVLGWILEQGGS